MLKIFSMPWHRAPATDEIASTDPMSHPEIARMDQRMLADLPAAALRDEVPTARGAHMAANEGGGPPTNRRRHREGAGLQRARPCTRPWGLSGACP